MYGNQVYSKAESISNRDNVLWRRGESMGVILVFKENELIDVCADSLPRAI
jgi:hypothetical protein